MGSTLLTDFQTNRVWESMLAAEARSLYFADLAGRYSRRKQLITGLTFFLSSGAAASLVGKLPEWVPTVLSAAVAVLAAYSIAIGLDRKISTMAKLHSSWNVISKEYDHLWNHVDDEDAEDLLDRILKLEKEPSELAATDAPNDQKLLEEWQDHVSKSYILPDQDG